MGNVDVKDLTIKGVPLAAFVKAGPQPWSFYECNESNEKPPILDTPTQLPSLLLPGATFGVDKSVFSEPVYFESNVYFCSGKASINFGGDGELRASNLDVLHTTTTSNLIVTHYMMTSNAYMANVDVHSLRIDGVDISNYIYGPLPWHYYDCENGGDETPTLDTPAQLPSLLLPGATFGVDMSVFTKPVYFESNVYFCTGKASINFGGITSSNGNAATSNLIVRETLQASNVNTNTITVAGYPLNVPWMSNLEALIAPATSPNNSVSINAPLYVKDDITLNGCIYSRNNYSSNLGIWEICNEANNTQSSDLVFI
jgi:hypothetical protein